MSEHAFIDETKRHGLLLAVALFQPRQLGPARTAMRQLCLPGQTRLHFTKERDDRRRQALAVIVRTGVVVDVYDVSGIADQRHARATALRQIVSDLADAGAHRLVLEQDDSLLRSDQTTLYSAVRSADAVDKLAYEHLPARSEPLLWVADAAAWCWARGGPWRPRLEPIIRHVHTPQVP